MRYEENPDLPDDVGATLYYVLNAFEHNDEDVTEHAMELEGELDAPFGSEALPL